MGITKINLALVFLLLLIIARNEEGRQAPPRNPLESQLGLPNGAPAKFFLKAVGDGNELRFVPDSSAERLLGEELMAARFPDDITSVEAAELSRDPNTRFFLVTLRDGRLFGVIPGRQGQRPVGGPFKNYQGIRVVSTSK